MKALPARALWRCKARATSSLPVPDSPVISTVALVCDSRPIARNTSCIAAAWPSISVFVASPAAASVNGDAFAAWLALRISASAWSTSNGFGRYSNAPPWNDATALSRSEYAVITMTGICGWCALISESRLRPEPPGIRMSLTTTSGSDCPSAATASGALENDRYGIPSRAIAFSSTQRIERSSSTIHTAFMLDLSGVRAAARKTRVQRQQHGETGVLGLAFAFDGAVMLGHECLGNRQSETAATLATGDQRKEYFLE